MQHLDMESLFTSYFIKLKIGVCYLQHRVSVGAHNQGVNRIHSSGKTKNASVFSLLTGSWLQYFRPCFAAFIYFLYLYIIIITLGMTVDLHN